MTDQITQNRKKNSSIFKNQISTFTDSLPNSTNVTKIHRRHHHCHSHRRYKINDILQNRDYSTITNNNLSISKIIDNRSQLFKNDHYKSNRIDVTDDYHRNLKKNKKQKKCSKLRVIISLFIILLLIAAIITPILLISLNKTTITTTTTTTNKTVLLRWNTTGITIAGVSGIFENASNQLYRPWDIALDSSNTLYVTDRFNNRIQKFLVSTTNGIALDSNGNSYVADKDNNRIVYISNDISNISTIAGISGSSGSGINQLNEPHGLAIDTNSNTLYIADYAMHRIRCYLHNAVSGTTVAGGNGAGLSNIKLNYPTAVFFDSLTNSLIIANYASNNIVRWVLGANNWTLIAGNINGLSGNTSTYFSNPIDVMLDPMGNMYVADRYNHRIQFFGYGESNGSTIIGITGKSGNSSNLLNEPISLIHDNQLNLYVADNWNHRIQKFMRY